MRADLVTVRGGRPLTGVVHPAGFKHALVTTVAASLLGRNTVVLHNVPDIAESAALTRLVSELGANVEREPARRRLRLRCADLTSSVLDAEVAGSIHGSVYLVPGLLARLGRVDFPESGGCQIGEDSGVRPIHQYVDVLGRFGVHAEPGPDGLVLTADRLVAADIDLADYTVDRDRLTGPLYSGATKTALLAAAAGHGTSVIRHPYPKPDVLDLVTVLRAMGCEIVRRVDDNALIVVGSRGLALQQPADHALCADLIEIVTWLAVGAVGSDDGITVTGVGVDAALTALQPELSVLDRLAVDLQIEAGAITVRRRDSLTATDILVHSHGVFSDSHPFLALVAALASGTSRVTETVWTRRFGYVNELRAIGVAARTSGHSLEIQGPWSPRPADRPLVATDLRAAAVLLTAAIAVPAETHIEGTHHLVRGYEDLPAALASVGADIRPGDTAFAASPLGKPQREGA